jgi:hypothetical protein
MMYTVHQPIYGGAILLQIYIYYMNTLALFSLFYFASDVFYANFMIKNSPTGRASVDLARLSG